MTKLNFSKQRLLKFKKRYNISCSTKLPTKLITAPL